MTRHHDLPVHPDDLLFFNEVAAAMRRVAKQYGLPVRNISGLSMPESGMADRLGDCDHTGNIRLVLRCTVDGEWCNAPLSPANVWDTAAHELAHLRHWNHGDDHARFTQELSAALKAKAEVDEAQRILDKVLKLQNQADGEKKIGNVAAAEAFAAKVSAMLIDHELTESDVEYHKNRETDPVVEILCDLKARGIKFKKSRVAWQESLARIVARAHLCSFLIRAGSNHVWFVGTKTHATLAEYAYGTLVPVIEEWSIKETRTYTWQCWEAGDQTKARGFRAAWLEAFLRRINERFDEVRKAAVAADVEKHGVQSTALIRLEGALVKVNKYVNNKFKSRGGLNALQGRRGSNAEGRARGIEAANRVTIGRRGVAGAERKQLA